MISTSNCVLTAVSFSFVALFRDLVFGPRNLQTLPYVNLIDRTAQPISVYRTCQQIKGFLPCIELIERNEHGLITTFTDNYDRLNVGNDPFQQYLKIQLASATVTAFMRLTSFNINTSVLWFFLAFRNAVYHQLPPTATCSALLPFLQRALDRH